METYTIKFNDYHNRETDEHLVTCEECEMSYRIEPNTQDEKLRVLSDHVKNVHRCNGGQFGHFSN